MSKIKVTGDKSELEKIAENTKQLVDMANAETNTSQEITSEVKISNIDVLLNAIGTLTNNINDNFKELNQTMIKSKGSVAKDTKEKPKKSNKTKTDDKLLKAVTDLNTSLNSSFNNLAKILNEANKPTRKRRNNEELSIDKIKVEKEKALAAHQLKIQALNEKLVKSRLSFAEENHKRFLEKNYDDKSIATVPYRAYQNIQGQGSNALSATALSLMTGGIINPAMAKEFGLDKIVTAGTKFAGRTVAKATDTAWNMTGGLAWRNLSQPFTDPNSRLRQGMTNGTDKFSKGFNSGFGLFSKDEEEGKTSGAVAKDKDKMNKLQKTVEDIKNYITKPKDKDQPVEKEKKKSLLDKIFEAIGGMGLILKGAAVAAIPYVVKAFLPKATEWLDKKMKEFMSGTLGFSESTVEGASQILKDALPGALFGMTVGGWKGALIGAGLSLGINWIVDKWDEFRNGANKEEVPTKIGPFDADSVEAALGGAMMGAAFGWKGALWGAALGFGANTLFKTVNDWKAILTGEGEVKNDLGDYFAGALTGAMSAMALPGPASAKKLALGAAIGIAIPWITQQVDDWKAIFGGKGKKADAEKLGDEVLSGAIGGALLGFPNPVGMALGAVIGASLPLIKSLASDWKGTIQILKNGLASIKQFAKDMVTHPIDTFKKLFGIGEDDEEAVKEGYDIGKAGEKPEEIKDPVPLEMIDVTRPMMEEKYQQTFDPRTEEEKHQSLTPQRQAELDKTHAKVELGYTPMPKKEEPKQNNVENVAKGVVAKSENKTKTSSVKPTSSQQQVQVTQPQVKDTIGTVIDQAANDLSGLTPSQIYNFAAGTTSFEDIMNAQISIPSLSPTYSPATNIGVSNGSKDAGGVPGPITVEAVTDNGNYNTKLVNGIQAVPMKDLGLSGTIASINSKPYIAPYNVDNLKTLDKAIDSWGYDIIYTSAMGGSHAGGPRSHAAGQKVDLQLKKNGKPTRMTPSQETALISAGFARNGSGALGWEPVAGQVLGGHYDYSIGPNKKGNVASSANSDKKQDNLGTSASSGNTAMASAAPTSIPENVGKASDTQSIKLETQSMPTAQESQTMAMNTMTETAQATAESTAASNDSILGLLDSMNGNIATTAMNTSNVTRPTGGIDSSPMGNMQMPQMSDMSISLPGNSGGNNQKDNTVYAFGDVAKTPILYTL